jgi:hypothetical protein
MPDITELASAVLALSKRRDECPETPITRLPEFEGIVDVCIAMFPTAVGQTSDGEPDRIGARWALSNALSSTGLPTIHKGEGEREAATAESVAEAVYEAMVATETTLVHLCPLDMADALPQARFGPCEVRQFSASEIDDLVQMPRLKRRAPRKALDVARLSEFSCLTVRELVNTPNPVGKRAIPIWYSTALADYGEISPHARPWPPVVDGALFLLLLMPWEELVVYPNIDWRAFHVPWIYTANRDLFVSPEFPPDADTLSWQPDLYQDADGVEVEVERPMARPLKDGAQDMFASLTDQRWKDVERALRSPIFNTLVVHFLVRAFAANDIDEFVSHVIVIEAALGMQIDFDAKARPKLPGNKNPGATERVACRARAITGEANAYVEYKELFDIRSQFVHGRHLGKIPSGKRVMARSLARRVADGLVSAALTTAHSDRDSFLSALYP